MRIGIDSHAAEQDGTGNCTYYRNLIREIANLDQQNEYFIFATNKHHPFYRNLANHPNFKIIQIPGYPAWFRVYVALAYSTYRFKLDVLHVQYFAPIFFKGHLVNTIHDLAAYHFPEFFSGFERMLFRWILPSSSRKAKIILTASEVSKRDLINMLNTPAEKVMVSFCGVNQAFAQEPTEESYQRVRNRYSLEGKFLLYVGRIDPRKNLVRLIQAYSELRSKYGYEHKLLIAGKVYLEPEALQKTVKQSAYSKDIFFCGYVSDEDLPILYRLAEVFVYTSEYEGFGLPPLEAMAAGTPVVASNIGIFREILGDAAVLVNPRDVPDIQEAMNTILSNRELRQCLIQKGKERTGRFDWASTARITLQGYARAVDNQTE